MNGLVGIVLGVVLLGIAYICELIQLPAFVSFVLGSLCGIVCMALIHGLPS